VRSRRRQRHRHPIRSATRHGRQVGNFDREAWPSTRQAGVATTRAAPLPGCTLGPCCRDDIVVEPRPRGVAEIPSPYSPIGRPAAWTRTRIMHASLLQRRGYFSAVTVTVRVAESPPRCARSTHSPGSSSRKNVPHSSPGLFQFDPECLVGPETGASRWAFGPTATTVKSPVPVARQTTFTSRPASHGGGSHNKAHTFRLALSARTSVPGTPSVAPLVGGDDVAVGGVTSTAVGPAVVQAVRAVAARSDETPRRNAGRTASDATRNDESHEALKLARCPAPCPAARTSCGISRSAMLS
jgi:hypothetical protein